MNPYQVMGIIACCTLIFAGVVTILTMQGVPLLLAFLSVYLIAVWSMLGMQRRARQIYDGSEHMSGRRFDRDTAIRRVRVNDPANSDTELSAENHLRA